jgi:hypothetical protein
LVIVGQEIEGFFLISVSKSAFILLLVEALHKGVKLDINWRVNGASWR